jgi:hypothetical protein
MMRLIWPNPDESVRDDWKLALSELGKREPMVPFAPEALQFIQELSQRLLRLRQYPPYVALGYWLRKAHIAELRRLWLDLTRQRIVRPRGTVFHIAPSNVDTIFVYSWMLSLLAGNRNIIRLSSKKPPETDELLAVLTEVLSDPRFAAVSRRTAILTYEHDDEVTAYLSSICHTRVIWGGDATVRAIRRIPLSPTANELAFPNRFSFAVIRASAFGKADSEAKREVVRQFYNDVFWFAQMACSSPRILCWIGSEDETAEAQELFWRLMDRAVEEQHPELTPAWQVQKLAASYALAAEHETNRVDWRPAFARVIMDGLPEGARERHCGAGLIYECRYADLAEVASMVVDADQTLTYFGYSREELADFVRLIPARGIDRIVPIGQALNFDAVWDGQNFLQSFSREVVIR